MPSRRVVTNEGESEITQLRRTVQELSNRLNERDRAGEAARAIERARVNVEQPRVNVYERRVQNQDQDQLTWLTIMDKFLKYNTPMFDGTGSAEDAVKWQEDLETLFTAMGYTEIQKQKLAVLRLSGNAKAWWQSSSRGENPVIVTWATFCRRFEDTYVLDAIKATWTEEFVHLKQEGMIVTEYEAKFNRLSHFVLDMVRTDRMRAHRFQEGLIDGIRTRIVGQLIVTYREVVASAKAIEQDYLRHKRARDNGKVDSCKSMKGKQVIPSSQQEQKKRKNGNGSTYNSREQHYNGSDKPFMGSCYICHERGHRKSECPNRRQVPLTQVRSEQAMPPSGRVFAIEGHDDRALVPTGHH